MPLNAGQAYVAEILADLLTSTPECAALWAPAGHVLREGETMRNPELGEALERLGARGAGAVLPRRRRGGRLRVAAARGGSLGPADLAGYARDRARAGARSATAIARSSPTRRRRRAASCSPTRSALLDRGPAPPTLQGIVDAMAAAQARAQRRSSSRGSPTPGFLERFLVEPARLDDAHLGDRRATGMACAVTCTNGEGSGVVVPGTGIHLNNVMGEEDLNPLGFHLHPAGRRMPSMMAPVDRAARRRGRAGARQRRLQPHPLGAAADDRGVVDRGLGAAAAVDAPRMHFEDGVVYAEPGIDLDGARRASCRLVRFRALNLFFGGVQAALRRDGRCSGAGDPRRGGAAVLA